MALIDFLEKFQYPSFFRIIPVGRTCPGSFIITTGTAYETIAPETPFLVPTDDGLVIEEHFGRAGIADERLSLARLIAPPHWVEPHQTPEFDEYTLVYTGRKQIKVDGKTTSWVQGNPSWSTKAVGFKTRTPLTNRLPIVRFASPLSLLRRPTGNRSRSGLSLNFNPLKNPECCLENPDQQSSVPFP